jgi:hypothetical protein
MTKCKSFFWNPIKENTTNKIENTGITAPIISQTLSEKISKLWKTILEQE